MEVFFFFNWLCLKGYVNGVFVCGCMVFVVGMIGWDV